MGSPYFNGTPKILDINDESENQNMYASSFMQLYVLCLQSAGLELGFFNQLSNTKTRRNIKKYISKQTDDKWSEVPCRLG